MRIRRSNETCQRPGCNARLTQRWGVETSIAGPGPDDIEAPAGPVICERGHEQEEGVADDHVWIN
jgi:hypothetical protein